MRLGIYLTYIIGNFEPFVNGFEKNSRIASKSGVATHEDFSSLGKSQTLKLSSKKVRASLKLKGESGEHLTTIPPYGYVKDADNSEQWIVDDEAAEVVKRIFALCMDGYGPTQIARILKGEQVLTPTVYKIVRDRRFVVHCPIIPMDGMAVPYRAFWNEWSIAVIP